MNDSFFKNEEYEGGALEAVGGDLDGSKRILQGGKKRKAYWVLVSSFHFDKNKVPKIEVSFAQEVWDWFEFVYDVKDGSGFRMRFLF